MKDKVFGYWNDTLAPSIQKNKVVLLSCIGGVVLFNLFFTVGINATESLPDHVFLILKQDRNIKKGDYVAFKWNGGGPYPAGLTFVKLVKGVEGDIVEENQRNFYVSGSYAGLAKERSLKGVPLDKGITGVIPSNHFYAYAPNKDSLDSRYALMGLVSYERIVGRAIPLF